MAYLTPAALVAKVAAQLDADLAASGWTRSRYPIDLFPGDARGVMHKSYSVGLGSSQPYPKDRQRPTNGTPMSTTVVVRFAWSIRADAQVGDYAAALDGEVALVQTVMGTPKDGALYSLLVEQVSARDVVDSGSGVVYLGEVRFRADHRYQLAA